MKKFTVITGIIVLLLFSACDNFFGIFTTPLLDVQRKIDPDSIDVNSGNIDAWVDRAIEDPVLAAAILQSILNDLEDGDFETDEEKAKMISAALKLGVNATGVKNLILGEGVGLISVLFDESSDPDNIDMEEMIDTAVDIFIAIVSNLDMVVVDDIAAVSSYLIVSDSNPPEFIPGFEPSPSDVAMTLIVLTLGIANEFVEDVSDLLESFKNGGEIDISELTGDRIIINDDGDIVVGSDEKSQALGAYINLVINNDTYKDNPITGLIYSLFGGDLS